MPAKIPKPLLAKKKPVSKAKATPARTPAKRAVGRPSAYRAAYAEQAYKLCLLGATDADMAEFFEVAESTINLWKQKHPEFSESIKRGKADADANVAEALYKRAVGYSHPDTHISNYQGEVIVTPITKHYPPDPVSMIFWLKNRQPAKWRDRIEHQADVTVTGPGSEALQHLYEVTMKRAQERQQAILAERGLLDTDGGPDRMPGR